MGGKEGLGFRHVLFSVAWLVVNHAAAFSCFPHSWGSQSDLSLARFPILKAGLWLSALVFLTICQVLWNCRG